MIGNSKIKKMMGVFGRFWAIFKSAIGAFHISRVGNTE